LDSFISFNENDFLTGYFEERLYSRAVLKGGYFLDLYNEKFNFRSIYFLILGTKILLRLLFIPLVMWVLNKCAKDANIFKKKGSEQNKRDSKLGSQINISIEPNQGLITKIFVKVVTSLFLMTQFEGFTYMVTSLRVGPGLWDWFMILTNISVLVVSQLVCYRIV
jgi:hypothetical protein